jgi:hypothetical protein
MKKILPKTVGILMVCIAVFLFNSCIYKKYLADVDPAVVAELERLGVVPTAVAKVQQIEIPEDLNTDGYYYYTPACEQGGYDLNPSAGKTVTLTSVDIKGTCLGEKITIRVFSEEDKIVCAYLTLREGSSGAPGVWPINSAECEY